MKRVAGEALHTGPEDAKEAEKAKAAEGAEGRRGRRGRRGRWHGKFNYTTYKSITVEGTISR